MSLWYPPFIEWEITPSCNHNCVHCYNYWRSNDEISIDADFDHNADFTYYETVAEKIIDSKPVSVAITGGEPFIVFSKVKSAIDMLLHAGIEVSINTNATLLNDDILAFLRDRPIKIFASFPCAEPTVCDKIVGVKGTLKRITEAICTLKEAGIDVATNTVVSELNYPYIEMTADYLKNVVGQKYFCATRACLPVNAKEEFRKQILSREHFNELMKTLLKIRQEKDMDVDFARAYSLCSFQSEDVLAAFAGKRQCSGGKLSFVVTSEGNIKACAMDSEIYGNILTGTFSSAIAKMASWQDLKYLPDDCKACKCLNLCGGGCRIDALTTFGDFSKLDPLSMPNALPHIDFSREDSFFPPDVSCRVSDCVCVTRENNCLRISRGSRYTFLAEDAFELLRQMSVFSIYDMEKNLHLDSKTAANILTFLIDVGIIETL